MNNPEETKPNPKMGNTVQETITSLKNDIIDLYADISKFEEIIDKRVNNIIADSITTNDLKEIRSHLAMITQIKQNVLELDMLIDAAVSDSEEVAHAVRLPSNRSVIMTDEEDQ